MLQVETAKQHWAKASVSCAKEAKRLKAALEANSNEMEVARVCVADAESALATLERQQAGKDASGGHDEPASAFEGGDVSSCDEGEAVEQLPPADESSPGMPARIGAQKKDSIAAALRASKSHLISACPLPPLQTAPTMPAAPGLEAAGGGVVAAAGSGTSLQAKLDLLPILTSPAFKRFVALHPTVIARTLQPPPPALANGQAVVVAQVPAGEPLLCLGM